MELETTAGRALASVQIVEAVDPHPNADRLELITVLGWQVCEVKGALKVGDRVVYCEIDSLLPTNAVWLPEAIKDRVSNKGDEWYHVKTIKLRGEISQGLILPLTLALQAVLYGSQIYDGVIGEDVTRELGIRKYETSQESLSRIGIAGAVSGQQKFPTHLVDKTDETRVQSAPKLFHQLLGQPYYATVKMDGTSVTFVRSDVGLLVCSRNLIQPKPDNERECKYHAMAAKYNLDDILSAYPHLAVQGEICGPNIQKNWANLKELELFVFNVVDVPRRQKLSFSDMISWCDRVGLNTVPVEEVGDAFRYDRPKLCLEKARGKYPNSKWPREGLVYRSQDQKISFKAINNDFLLKRGE